MSRIRKSSFKPAKYEKMVTSKKDQMETPYSESSENSEEIVTKDDDEILKIDLNRLESDLSELRENDYRMIRDLDGELNNKFKRMVSYVHLLYDTDHYNILYDLVKSKFSDLNDIKPGTIGAYFGGCLADVNINNIPSSCTPITVRSMPPPKSYINETGWSFCDNNIIWAEKVLIGNQSDVNAFKYIFTVLNSIPDSKKGLVFINETVPSQFMGFTEDEKDTISKMNIDDVKIIGYNSNGREYIDITPDHVPLSTIKTRLYISPNEKDQINVPFNDNNEVISKNSSTTSSNTGMILLLIIVILILVFFIWRMWSR